MRWSLLTPGACVTSYVRSNVLADVVDARKSVGEVKPSGETRSTYASTLLPTVWVAPGASHGSLVEMGPAWSESRLGLVSEGRKKSGVAVGCGEGDVPWGPSCGRCAPVVWAQTR